MQSERGEGSTLTTGDRQGVTVHALGPTTASVLGLGADMARLFDHVTRRRGSVTFSQFQLLALLRATHPDPREPWELGRGLGSGSAQVTALIDGLERAGLVRRSAHGQDRRRRWIHLTEAGRQRAQSLGEIVRTLEARILGGALSSKEIRALGQAAERLRAVVGELTASDLSFLLTAEPGHRPADGDL